MDFRQGGPGFASLFVDARRDGRNVWWALIERRVLPGFDVGRLKQPGRALRIEVRLRVSEAPRRVNLQILTQRTTDYESNLMEFDIAEPMKWQAISLTKSADVKDSGLVRVVEILGGEPAWRRKTVTGASLCRGREWNRVLNPQMVIDGPVSPGDGGKSYFVISRAVLQRLLDGKTLGLALLPLGGIHAAFYSVENQGGKAGARLLFNAR